MTTHAANTAMGPPRQGARVGVGMCWGKSREKL